jgi:hypothetical protein
MRDLLDQLYKTKLQLIAFVSVAIGVVVLFLAHWSTTASAPHWLSTVPLTELGSTVFGTGLLAVFFEYVDRKHGDRRTDERIRAAVRKEAPAIRDAVLDSLAFNANALKDVASPALLDKIAANALGLRLDDHQLAQYIYTDVRDQVIRAPERWHDLSISVSLSLPTTGTASGERAMFAATVRMEYRVQHPNPTARFACVSDLDEYRELLRDPATTAAWYFDRSAGLDAGDQDVYELVQLAVNGKARPVRRHQRAGSQHYTVSLGQAAIDAGEVTVSCTYRVLVQQHGHLLYLDVPQPTKGLHVQFAYGGCGIREVNTLDFIASAQQPRVLRSVKALPTPSVDVGFDGWVFPKSGVAFVWVLESEMSTQPGRQDDQ